MPEDRGALRNAAYRDVEELLDADPAARTFRHQRACLIGLLGRREQAQAAFLELLAEDPKDFGVLNDFAMFLFASGLRSAAAVALREAIRWHPDDAVAHTNLGSLLLTDGNVTEAKAAFERAIALDAANPKAHEGLSLALARLGDVEGARRARPTVVRAPGTVTPFQYGGSKCTVLLVESAIGGNTYVRELLDDPAFDVRQVFIEFFDDAIALPEHQVIWNAVSDAERCANILSIAPGALARSDAPVINAPDVIRDTGRVAISERMRQVSGVVAPRARSFARATLTSNDARRTLDDAGFGYPLLLRSPGFHTGEHFVRIERPDDVQAAAAAMPGRSLTALQFVDVRSTDGKVRKYRVMAIDGKLFPLHAAIARDWKVHYFSAEMAENPEHRAEDKAFLDDMVRAIGPNAVGALQRITEKLGLDYAGIDFALDSEGRVVVFEANATMIVPPVEDEVRWAYRRPAVQRIYDAVRRMVMSRARDVAHITEP